MVLPSVVLALHSSLKSKAKGTAMGRNSRENRSEAHGSSGERQLPVGKGWRSVFGKARWEDVELVDAVMDEDFGKIEPDSWR